MDVRQDTTLCDRDVSQKLVQFLIVSDGELEMTRDDTSLLVVAGGVTSQFEDFGRKVLKDGRKVDRGTSTDTLSVVALSEKTVNTTDWECETSLGRSGLRVLGAAGLSSGFASSHFDELFGVSSGSGFTVVFSAFWLYIKIHGNG